VRNAYAKQAAHTGTSSWHSRSELSAGGTLVVHDLATATMASSGSDRCSTPTETLAESWPTAPSPGELSGCRYRSSAQCKTQSPFARREHSRTAIFPWRSSMPRQFWKKTRATGTSAYGAQWRVRTGGTVRRWPRARRRPPRAVTQFFDELETGIAEADGAPPSSDSVGPVVIEKASAHHPLNVSLRCAAEVLR